MILVATLTLSGFSQILGAENYTILTIKLHPSTRFGHMPIAIKGNILQAGICDELTQLLICPRQRMLDVASNVERRIAIPCLAPPHISQLPATMQAWFFVV